MIHLQADKTGHCFALSKTFYIALVYMCMNCTRLKNTIVAFRSQLWSSVYII